MAREQLDSGIEAEFANAQLKDVRRANRLVATVAKLACDPALSFPKAMGTSAALEGTYRLLENPAVTAEAIIEPHRRATAERISGQECVLIAHDTTSFVFRGLDTRRGLGPIARAGQGFFAHVSLAISDSESRSPLGVIASKTWARSGKKAKIRPEKRSQDPDRESKRWFEQVQVAQAAMPSNVRAIHVMDREGDAYECLSRLCESHSGFVVRSTHDRRLEGEHAKLYELLATLDQECEREVPLSRRTASPFPRQAKLHPKRDARMARLAFSAAPIEFQRPRYAIRDLAPKVELNVVRVMEVDPPVGEKPVEWILFTSEPISTTTEILRIVDIYRARWTIEELFKALKTGCSFEERQLESRHALENALAIFLPIAWRLLALRSLSRKLEDLPATLALTETQIEVLRAVTTPALAERPTAREALLAIARLGGHIKNNGPPGWQVLGRGYHDLLMMELGWLARKTSDQ